jgi:RNA polymerase sigma factor (sigma-70 family)
MAIQFLVDAAGERRAYHDHFDLAGKCFPLAVAKRLFAGDHDGGDRFDGGGKVGRGGFVGWDAALARVSAQYPVDLYQVVRAEVFRRGLSGELAQDALYDVFSEACRYLDQAIAEGRDVCKSYVERVVKGQLSQRLRAAARQGGLADKAAGEVATAAELAAGDAWDAYADAFAERAVEGLWAAVDDLPEAQQRAVRACWVDGLTQQQAAEAFDIAQQNVAKALGKARARLQADPRVLSAVDASI